MKYRFLIIYIFFNSIALFGQENSLKIYKEKITKFNVSNGNVDLIGKLMQINFYDTLQNKIEEYIYCDKSENKCDWHLDTFLLKSIFRYDQKNVLIESKTFNFGTDKPRVVFENQQSKNDLGQVIKELHIVTERFPKSNKLYCDSMLYIYDLDERENIIRIEYYHLYPNDPHPEYWGTVVKYKFNRKNQLLREENLNYSNRYKYNKKGKLILIEYESKYSVIDGAEKVKSEYDYDLNGNEILKVDFYSDSTCLKTIKKYNDKNFMIEERQINRLGNLSLKIEYVYDSNNKIIVEKKFDGSNELVEKRSIEYEYY